ncbi:MAG: LysM peptidoglycan-binding domain-containing protein [Actinomycetota bacterium]
MDLFEAADTFDPTVTLWILALGLILLRRVQVRRGKRNILARPAHQLLRPGTLLGFLLTIPHPADAHERRPLLPSRPKLAASEPPGGPAGKDLPDNLLAGPGSPPPWERDNAPGGDGPYDRAQEPAGNGTSSAAAPSKPTGKRGSVRDDRPVYSVHPAIHGSQRGEGTITPLFPRNGSNKPPGLSGSPDIPARDCPADDRAELLACMRRHPAGKMVTKVGDDAPKSRSTCRYTVRRGDTLWGLAAAHLQTDDVRRIARFWPKIHRQNRDVIGANPDLLFPGQMLEIPSECE